MLYCRQLPTIDSNRPHWSSYLFIWHYQQKFFNLSVNKPLKNRKIPSKFHTTSHSMINFNFADILVNNQHQTPAIKLPYSISNCYLHLCSSNIHCLIEKNPIFNFYGFHEKKNYFLSFHFAKFIYLSIIQQYTYLQSSFLNRKKNKLFLIDF
jgi:hypothetical protein